MDKEEATTLLRSSVSGFNEYRKNNPSFVPELVEADLKGVNLRRAELTGANLKWANLNEADLTAANLRRANLRGANLTRTKLIGASLRGEDLPDGERHPH